MGAKLFRCIGVIPNLSRAKRCCFVPYPEFFSQKYPGYLIYKNKGYGTKKHFSSLKEYGLTNLHRKSFLTKLNLI